MSIFDPEQQSIANKIEENSNISHWKDWHWQLKHSIKSIDKFDFLTEIRFDKSKFPLSITPYYLSLIPGHS
ncbi:MAG: hypothetical protein R6X28_04120 [Bacteroidales bacterium]